MTERSSDFAPLSDVQNRNTELSEADLEAFRRAPEADPTTPDQIDVPEGTRRALQVVDAAPLSSQKPDTLVSLAVGATASIAAGMTAFAIVAGIVLAIIVPPWYRSLEPRYQAIWCNRVSLLCELKEKRDTDNVYQLNVNPDNVVEQSDALVATETPTPTLMPTNTDTPVPTEAEAAAAATRMPTATDIPPSPTTTPSPTATPFTVPMRDTLQLSKLKWEEQGWNNCGPTTLTIGLTYFGYTDNQRRAANFLKPNIEDTNVSPNQMVAYVNTVAGPELGINALYRVGGDRELLMRLVANDFPVIVERGIILPEDGWMGHYSLIVGYDSVSEEYLLFDSYYGYSGGEGRRYEKEFIEEGWRQFNYVFIVLYEPHQADLLSDLLGEHADPAMAAQIALDRARDQVRRNPDDKWAWFNVGTSYTLLENYQDAALAYDRAFTMNQEFRMLWYQFGPYVAYYNTGRYSDVLALALATEKTTEYVEETYYYRGLVYAAQGNTDSAIFQFDRAISHNENFTPAIEAKQSVLEGRFSAPSG